MEFSRGQHAIVRTLGPDQRKLFPRADLVREEEAQAPRHFQLMFYAYKIPYTLFPQNFVEPVGSQADQFTRTRRLGGLRRLSGLFDLLGTGSTFLIYTRMAPVPFEHAQYAADMEVKKGKKVPHNCTLCQKHHDFHEERVNRDIFWQRVKQIEEAGFTLPIGRSGRPFDHSDFCFDSQDNPIFFETEDFSPDQCRHYLRRQGMWNETHQRVFKYIARYEQLYYKVYKKFPR